MAFGVLERRRTGGGPRRWPIPAWAVSVLLLVSFPGCQNDGRRRELPPEPAPDPAAAPVDDPTVVGTVGAQTLVAGALTRPLRGYGLVVGLDGSGSSDSPSVIREHLVDFMVREIGPQGGPDRGAIPSPEELIDSLDTAVVQVSGYVPAGARRGARFDLRVEAIVGTSTASLEGGLLLLTPLRFWDPAASGQGLLAGATLAEGAGPLFVNPLADESDAADVLRRGIVLGGGRAVEEHPTRLVLLEPSYTLAQTIERRINERFGQRPKVAEAISSGYLMLTTPADYVRQPARFRQLVAYLFIDNRSAYLEAKLRELARYAVAGGADYEHLALAWEAMGRSVIPHIQPFYTHADPRLRFHAARAGLRLDDLTALPVLGASAATATNPQRLAAIRELGRCDSRQVEHYLLPLLNGPEQELRIAAYEALLQHGHMAIRSSTFRHLLDRGTLNFILDVVDADGPPLIYVRCSRLPRIAVFGSRTLVRPPVFYCAADDSVTVHTVAGADDLRLYAKRRGRLSEEIVVPPRVAELITALGDLPLRDQADRLRGLGVPHSRIVQILAALCDEGIIPAELVLEPTSMAELLGPEVVPERPEGERSADGRETYDWPDHEQPPEEDLPEAGEYPAAQDAARP